MGTLVDLTGRRFGRWTVLGKAGRGRGLTRWTCRCDCGAARAVIGVHLRQGRSLSCGCVNRKLKAAEVRAIRLDRRTQIAIAKDYGIAQSVISRIKSLTTRGRPTAPNALVESPVAPHGFKKAAHLSRGRE